MSEQREFRVLWTPCPTAHNSTRVLFVEAANETDAKAIARDHIERTHGIEWITFVVTESKPVPAGKVITRDTNLYGSSTAQPRTTEED